MARKQEITSERIVESAFELLRRDGIESVNARSVAMEIGCSTQPIYLCFQNMEMLKKAICQRCALLYEDYCKREIESGKYPVYKAYGMAYIRMAIEEKEAFKYLFMRERNGEYENDLPNMMPGVMSEVEKNTGLDSKSAYDFHIEVWIFIHGIATMYATSYLSFDWEAVSNMVTDVYTALRAKKGGK